MNKMPVCGVSVLCPRRLCDDGCQLPSYVPYFPAWDDNHSRVVYCPFSRFRIIVGGGSDIVYNALNLYKYTFLTVKNLDKIFSQNRKRSVPIMPLSDVMNFSAPPFSLLCRPVFLRQSCEKGFIALRNGLYQGVILGILGHEMAHIRG